MPVYEYQCLDNGHRFELYQAVGAAPPSCSVCGSATRKVYGSVGLIFKGSGFHVTDYRRAAPPDGDGKADGKTAAKIAAGDTGSAAGKNGEHKGESASGSTAGGAEKSGSAPTSGA